MPRLAIALYLLWYVSLFVARTAVHFARTGSTGIKGFEGRPGSLPWLAGVALVIGFVGALLAPLAALFELPGGALWFESTGLHALGALLVLAGNAGALLAQFAMGDSWRVGVDESETTALVTTGLFAWVRNPIFSFMGVSLLGLLLLVPNAVAVVSGLLGVFGIEVQVRRVEEPYLARTHGAAYSTYAARVGRFVPKIGLGHASALEPGERAEHA